jgi:uncharacterized protein involved in exopolysaccharide biosynthesis
MLDSLKDEVLSLQALVTALKQFDQPLDESIQRELAASVKQFRRILRKYAPLEKYYHEALDKLSKADEHQPEGRFINSPVQVKRSILELEGLGKELWQGMDAQQYVDQERDSWNG